jgi:hypothetical protein
MRKKAFDDDVMMFALFALWALIYVKWKGDDAKWKASSTNFALV